MYGSGAGTGMEIIAVVVIVIRREQEVENIEWFVEAVGAIILYSRGSPTVATTLPATLLVVVIALSVLE